MKRARIVLLSFFVVGLFYLSTLITPNEVESLTRKVGWFGPFLIGALILLTQIFAPLSGTPGIFIGIKLYGFIHTLILLYIVNLLSAIVNFWIARAYGREIVRKLVGEKALKDIDELCEISEKTLLITSRLFGYYFFDIISYAIGLTRIHFGKYFFYTATLTVVPLIAQYILFSRVDFNDLGGMLIYFFSMAAMGIIFTKIIYRTYMRRKKLQSLRVNDQ